METFYRTDLCQTLFRPWRDITCTLFHSKSRHLGSNKMDRPFWISQSIFQSRKLRGLVIICRLRVTEDFRLLINFVISHRRLRTHIYLSKFIFSFFNSHMKAIFLTLWLTCRLMKPPWCSLLTSAFPISDQGSQQTCSHASNCFRFTQLVAQKRQQ